MKNKRFELISTFKSINVENSDELVITGLANAQTVDRVGDIILQEAYEKGGLDNYQKNPIILFNHNYDYPIGKTTNIGVGSDGLTITATISKAAGKVYDLIKENIVKSFSVGFIVKDAAYDTTTDIFAIKDIELLEVSAVSIPANQDSLFNIAKQFDTNNEYTEYKKQFASVKDAEPVVDDIVKTEDSTNNTSVEDANIEEINMTPEELKALEDKLAAMEKELSNTKGNLNAAEAMLDDAAEKELKAKAESEKAKAKIEVKSQVEELIKEVEARFEAKETTLQETLKGLETDLKDKSDEISSLTKNKMRFADSGNSRDIFTKRQREDAVLAAKLLGTDIKSTKFFKDIVQKSGLEHTPSADWEQEFNTSVFEQMKEKLIVEPLFNSITMTSPSMQIPLNPEAGDAQWIATGSFRDSSASTGTGVDHKMGETTLTAHKLASKEYMGYEEEEDTIISIVPIIRDAVTRRMARTSDQALLRGTGTGTGGDAVSPFKGLTTLAGDASLNTVTVPVASKWTVDNIQQVRRLLGAWGLNPGEVKYIVSQDVYFDLLEDPDFRTMDLVGDRATVISGQIGSVNGSPVVVSDSFLAKAATAPAVVAVYTGNFYVGNLRDIMVERDTNITNQSKVIIATRRMGFLAMETGKAAATGLWSA